MNKTKNIHRSAFMLPQCNNNLHRKIMQIVVFQ